MCSSFVQKGFIIPLKTREPSTKYGNSTDVNNQNTAKNLAYITIVAINIHLILYPVRTTRIRKINTNQRYNTGILDIKEIHTTE